ncbi:hypothetical protein JW992_09300, partial [candidate division KSB1 bacterium]|nr:hypothetical protein [candidate division KSB1 bacterium]
MNRLSMLKNRGRLTALVLPLLFIGLLYIYLFFVTRNSYEHDLEQTYISLLDRLADSLHVQSDENAVKWLGRNLISHDQVLYSVLLDRDNQMQQLVSKEDYLENYLFIHSTRPMGDAHFKRITQPHGRTFYHLIYPVHSTQRSAAAQPSMEGQISPQRPTVCLILLGISAQPVETFMGAWFRTTFPGTLSFILGFILLASWLSNRI